MILSLKAVCVRLSGAAWDEETPPLERVYAVVFELSYPVHLSYIADRANLSVDTTRHQLEQLHEVGIVETESYSSVQMYSFVDASLNIRFLYRLCTQRTPEELANMETALEEQIESWQDKYDSLSPRTAHSFDEDCAMSSTPPPLILGEWLFVNHFRTLIQKARAALMRTD